MKKRTATRRLVVLLALVLSLLLASGATVFAQSAPQSTAQPTGESEGQPAPPSEGTGQPPPSSEGTAPPSTAGSLPPQEEEGETSSQPASLPGGESAPSASSIQEDDSQPASSLAPAQSEAGPQAIADAAPRIAPGAWETGWTEYTAGNTYEGSFAITEGMPAGYTGQLRARKNSQLRRLSYYVTYNDGTTTTNIYYAYNDNSFGQSLFTLYSATGLINGSSNLLGNHNITSIWTKERAPGYTMVQARSAPFAIGGGQYEARVTMIPHPDGLVVHQWDIVNVGTETLEAGLLVRNDTELASTDNVPVYSLGTDAGMYIKVDGLSTLFAFPTLSAAEYGWYDYAATRYERDFTDGTVFGPNLDTPNQLGVAHAKGDLLTGNYDTGVFHRWLIQSIPPGERGSFAYGVQARNVHPVVQPTPASLTVLQGTDAQTQMAWLDADSGYGDLYLVGATGDTLVGPFTADTMAVTLPTAGLAPGQYSFVYYGVDEDGNESSRVTVQVRVMASPVITPTPASLTVPQGNDAQTQMAWLDADSGYGDLYLVGATGDTLVGTFAADTMAVTLPTAGLAPGQYSFVYYGVDADGNESARVTVQVQVTAAASSVAPASSSRPKTPATTAPKTGDSPLALVAIGILLLALAVGTSALVVYLRGKRRNGAK